MSGAQTSSIEGGSGEVGPLSPARLYWLRLFCVLPLPRDTRASWPDVARPPIAVSSFSSQSRVTFRDEDFFDLVSFFEIFDRRSSSSLQLSDIRIVRPFNRYVGITSVTLEMLSKGRQNSYDAFR